MVEAGENKEFGDALRQARAAEAAHFEALYTLSDAKALRLQILKDELTSVVTASPGTLELALEAGQVPRLWIDLITFVVMEPDPKTYRLAQHSEAGREIILETADRAEMVQQVKLILAHGAIARKRRAGASRLTHGKSRGYSAVALALAWFGGLGFGALTSLGAVICLRILTF